MVGFQAELGQTQAGIWPNSRGKLVDLLRFADRGAFFLCRAHSPRLSEVLAAADPGLGPTRTFCICVSTYGNALRPGAADLSGIPSDAPGWLRPDVPHETKRNRKGDTT